MDSIFACGIIPAFGYLQHIAPYMIAHGLFNIHHSSNYTFTSAAPELDCQVGLRTGGCIRR
jgi:hypothetical protein